MRIKVAWHLSSNYISSARSKRLHWSPQCFSIHLKFDVSPDPNCDVVCGAEWSSQGWCELCCCRVRRTVLQVRSCRIPAAVAAANMALHLAKRSDLCLLWQDCCWERGPCVTPAAGQPVLRWEGGGKGCEGLWEKRATSSTFFSQHGTAYIRGKFQYETCAVNLIARQRLGYRSF